MAEARAASEPRADATLRNWRLRPRAGPDGRLPSPATTASNWPSDAVATWARSRAPLTPALPFFFPCRSTGRPDGTPSGSGPLFFLRARASLASRCAAFLATRAFFSARASSRGSTPSAASRSETSMIGASASSPPTLS